VSGGERGSRRSNPVALVTGGSGGFGKALALQLDALGFRVAVHYNSSEAAARQTADLLTNESVVVRGDISSWADSFRLHDEVVQALGPVDVLVNNGGVRHDSLMAMQDPGQWRSVIDTNLLGAFHSSRLCLPSMLTQRWGRIINIVSPSALIATPGQTAYSASKAGLIGLTRTLAAECAARGVTVNALSPGFMITKMTEGLSDTVKDGIRAKCPMRRFGTTDEIARSVGFFVETDYMTGQVVSIDGGVSIT